MLFLILGSFVTLSSANQQAIDTLDRTKAGCVDERRECEAWVKYCANNDVVRRDCPATCRVCSPSPRDVALAKETKERLLRESVEDFTPTPQERVCGDAEPYLSDKKCQGWVGPDPSLCQSNDFIRQKCKGTCNLCKSVPRQYDAAYLPQELNPIGFLLGRWRSEAGGKARFPTIPNFTYGEQLDFSIADSDGYGSRALNYSAFAWGINNRAELHSEFGFVTTKEFHHNATAKVALTVAMNNGFVTVEEGFVGCWGAEGDFRSCPTNPSIIFHLEDIGRISFSRDLPVHGLKRTWKLLPSNRLEQILEMETLTHPPQEHTRIVYTKIFP